MPDPYAKLKEHFSRVKRVTVNAGQGALGMKLGKNLQRIRVFPPVKDIENKELAP